MATRKKARTRKKVSLLRRAINKSLDPQTIMLTFVAMAAAALLTLTCVACMSYMDWQVLRTKEAKFKHELVVQGHLNSVAPLIDMCLESGGSWVWIATDSAEMRGLCVQQKQQSHRGPLPNPSNQESL